MANCVYVGCTERAKKYFECETHAKRKASRAAPTANVMSHEINGIPHKRDDMTPWEANPELPEVLRGLVLTN